MLKTRLTKLAALALVVGFVSSCSTPSEIVNIDNSTKGYRITCGGAYSTVSECYQKAGQICGNKGYTVIHETDIAPPADANYFWNAAAHEVLVKCNNGGR